MARHYERQSDGHIVSYSDREWEEEQASRSAASFHFLGTFLIEIVWGGGFFLISWKLNYFNLVEKYPNSDFPIQIIPMLLGLLIGFIFRNRKAFRIISFAIAALAIIALFAIGIKPELAESFV